MRTEKFSGTIASAFGKTLDAPLTFNGSYEAFGPDKDPDTYREADWDSAIAELNEKKEFPSNKEVVQFVNNKRKANERQKAMAAALEDAGIKAPTLEDDPQLQLKAIYKALMASGKKTHEQARQVASQTLGIEWAD